MNEMLMQNPFPHAFLPYCRPGTWSLAKRIAPYSADIFLINYAKIFYLPLIKSHHFSEMYSPNYIQLSRTE